MVGWVSEWGTEGVINVVSGDSFTMQLWIEEQTAMGMRQQGTEGHRDKRGR